MTTVIATATEMQNNFGKYAKIVQNGDHVLVTKNGKVIGKFIPTKTSATPLTDSLIGILKGDYDLDQIKEERMREKYEIVD